MTQEGVAKGGASGGAVAHDRRGVAICVRYARKDGR